MSGESQQPAVRRRQVYYIAGYDPRGPLHYHGLYRAECGKQTAINGLSAEVGRRKPVDDLEQMWTITAGGTETAYSYLRYEDIVRARWPSTALAAYGATLGYAWQFIRMGVYAAVRRSSYATFNAIAYPPAVIAGMWLVAAIVYALAAVALHGLGLVSWLLALPILGLPFLAYTPLNEKLNAFWLARSCAFLSDRSRGKTPEVEARCAAFGARIAAAVNTGGHDEVMLVGHSVGSHLAITAAARALEQMKDGTRLSLLTLGQSIAMMPDEEASAQFRKDLLAVALAPAIDWVDVTSAIDSSCIALTDPLTASGVVRPKDASVRPKLVSARFNKAFRPETYASIRGNYLRAHFQYLMASELATDYDYFLITAGGLTLWERFAHLESITSFNRFRRASP